MSETEPIIKRLVEWLCVPEQARHFSVFHDENGVYSYLERTYEDTVAGACYWLGDPILSLAAALDEAESEAPITQQGGCSDHGCCICKPKGQSTNGGCRCTPSALRHHLYVQRQKIRELEAKIKELEEAAQ
jgi:hypothetical protein